MTTTISTPTVLATSQYHLPEADRKAILRGADSSSNGLGPSLISTSDIHQQRQIFIEKNGSAFGS